jgi:hypothetical protein
MYQFLVLISIFRQYYLNSFNVKEREKRMGSGIIIDRTRKTGNKCQRRVNKSV